MMEIFFLKFSLRVRKSDFKWVLVDVYRAAQPEFKESFLTELVRACDNKKLPLCIGGDFNIIRNSTEKIIIDLRVDDPSYLTRSLIA
jgi:hypothetical protein